MPEVLATLGGAINWWEFFAGLGLFLLGMQQTERALQRLAGHRIRGFLRRNTDHPLEAISAGIVTTALLQSSSLVGLLTLAMVGASVIPLSSAIGVVIGANLGTTMTGWVVATIGFKLELSELAVPLLAAGSIGLSASHGDPPRKAWFRLATALGLLLLGLDFMKTSVATDSLAIPVTDHSNRWWFLILGVLVTAVIQSSSAAMMMTLAALHAGTISLLDGAAFMIGADLGTTSTVLLGAIQGNPDRRRVGIAHLLFNLVTDVMAFFFLLPLLPSLVTILPSQQPLFFLVGFHSAFNLVGIALFFPLIGAFSRLLTKVVKPTSKRIAQRLSQAVSADVATALTAMEMELNDLATRTVDYLRDCLDHQVSSNGASPSQQYAQIKQLESELVEFSFLLQAQTVSEPESRRLSALVSAARELVHAAKSMKDCRHDLSRLRESLSAAEQSLHQNIRERSAPLLDAAMRVMSATDEIVFEELAQMRALNEQSYRTIHRLIFTGLGASELNWPTVSSLLNANRELYIANAELARGIGFMRLNLSQVEDLESLPATPAVS